MELYGLVFALPLTFFISLVYSFLMTIALNWSKIFKYIALFPSFLILLTLCLEAALLILLGAKQSYATLGTVFTVVHFMNFFGAPAALANIIIVLFSYWNLPQFTKWSLSTVASTLICWVACMSVLLGNIVVDEAIVGVDAEHPFWMTSSHNDGI